jgi:hypothetical protein
MGLAAVEIDGRLLQNMMTEGWEGCIECIEGLPMNAEFRGSYARQWEGIYIRAVPTVVLIFEHPSFSDFEDGMAIPFIPIVFRER